MRRLINMEVDRMKQRARFLLFLTALALLVPLVSHAGLPWMDVKRLYMRSTTAASAVVVNSNWALGSPGSPGSSAFTDSLTFAHASATGNGKLIDTTAAYPVRFWKYPPTLASRGGQYGSRNMAHILSAGGPAGANAQTDSIVVDTTDSTPWIVVRVRQDSTMYSFAGASTIDSVYLAAQWSPDGINWLSVSGTPTRAHVVATVTSGADGLQPPILAGAENLLASDYASFPLECQPNVAKVSNTGFIINRTLCMAPGFVRFLVSIADDGYGQYAVEVMHWTDE